MGDKYSKEVKSVQSFTEYGFTLVPARLSNFVGWTYLAIPKL